MKDKLGIARAGLFRAIRGLEMLGLLLLLFGLASSHRFVAGARAVLILALNRIFRLRLPNVGGKDNRSIGMSDGD